MNTVSSNTTLANRIAWADVYFTAEAGREPFEDVEIVTLKSSYLDLALVAAADILLKERSNSVPSTDDVMNIAKLIMDDHKIFIQEHVNMSSEGITVCINAASLDDEDVVWRALDMLADALEHLDGAHGTVYFGEQLRFSSNEIVGGVLH